MLGGDPKGKNFLYTNGNSVIIRNIEVWKFQIVTNCRNHAYVRNQVVNSEKSYHRMIHFRIQLYRMFTLNTPVPQM